MVNNSNENAIREAAYYIWQNAGCPSGRDQEFWALAVEQFNNCKSSSKKSCSSKKSTTATCKSASAKKTSSKKSK